MLETSPFAVGDIEVRRIVEMVLPFRTPEDFYEDATPELVDPHRKWLSPNGLCPHTGKLILTVQSYLVKTRHHTILIDTCVGCGKTNPRYDFWHKRSDTSWLDRLAAAGAAPEDIDFVMCTHLHADHTGWNTRLENGRWVPTFPNARYIMSKADVEHFGAITETDRAAAYNESVLPVIEAGQCDPVSGDHVLDDQIRLEPTPGHTPGHVAVGLESKGSRAVMSGDLIHSPLQCLYPDWRTVVDTDAELARRTRRRFLEDASESRRLVMTGHFPAPCTGFVSPEADAFAFEFATNP